MTGKRAIWHNAPVYYQDVASGTFAVGTVSLLFDILIHAKRIILLENLLQRHKNLLRAAYIKYTGMNNLTQKCFDGNLVSQFAP